ncbi:hypothetical protein K2173_023182 [Erythroxylum novogranatense]|uniref:Ent-kaurene synthase n=1 Tax=Erythroxylum novogranatense TaxID=1862640 RepID=A0AAV8U7U7_9ROSI|nr:hypothetical protein K2173_023182 [Erythroxylum novogranatense]
MLVANSAIVPNLPTIHGQRKQRHFSSFEARSQLQQLDPTSLDHRLIATSINGTEESRMKKKLSEMLRNVDVSVSPYDTAWVAMVPSSREKPLFPECLDWVMKHQLPDGSWSTEECHPLLLKDSISSTLSCVLALNKWNLGERLVTRGLEFLETNSWAALDEKQRNPIGFDVVFPHMIQSAIESGLKLPMEPSLIDRLLRNKDDVIRRSQPHHLAYALEGLGNAYEWKEIKKLQRSNGSLFNSPSATAAALIRNFDENVIVIFPTSYPLDISVRLQMIDDFQKLGIDRYFTAEIDSAMAEIYGCWLQGDEQIFSDVNCCALTFRLLRMHGYHISSGALGQYEEEKEILSSVDSRFRNVNTILELHKASQTFIYQNEPTLERIKAWTDAFLKQELQSGKLDQDKRLQEEVKYSLRYTYDGLERLEAKRNLELFDIDNLQLLKTSHRSSNVNNKDMLLFSVKDYNFCQSIYQKEIQDLERWVKDNKLDQLDFARQKLNYCYFSTAAIIYQPQLSEARISMTKNCVLATVFDDFFDCGGSTEELENMMKLFERWEGNSATGFCSAQVEILFSSLATMINELGSAISQRLGRNVIPHLVQIWRDFVVSMMKEAEWTRENQTPTLDEYMENGYVSFALGPIVLIPLYSMGPNLSEEMISSEEYQNLFKLVSLDGRLLNDLASVQREGAQGKVNSVSLRLINGSMTEEESIEETRRLIESYRRELLKMVLQSEGSVIPKACKELFWRKSHVLHYFYKNKDGYSCPLEKINDAKAVLWEPISNLALLNLN